MTTLDDVLFVGFNRRVVALDKRRGDLIWSWKAPQGSSYVSLLVEGEHLFVCVSGYTYCLESCSGAEVWANPLKGLGMGVATLATLRSSSRDDLLGAAAAQRATNAAATGGAAGAH